MFIYPQLPQQPDTISVWPSNVAGKNTTHSGLCSTEPNVDFRDMFTKSPQYQISQKSVQLQQR